MYESALEKMVEEIKIMTDKLLEEALKHYDVPLSQAKERATMHYYPDQSQALYVDGNLAITFLPHEFDLSGRWSQKILQHYKGAN